MNFSSNARIFLTAAGIGLMMSVQAVAGGAQQIDQAAMQAVCETKAALSVGPSGDFQCDVCPSYTDFHGNRKLSFNLQKVFRGHFSTADHVQALLVLSGCENHADGFGGTALLTPEGKGWNKSAYFKGFKPSACLPFKGRDGLDHLACRESDMHFGTAEYWIETVLFEGNSLHKRRALPLIIDNMAGLGFPVKGYCYEQNISRFEKLSSGAGFLVVVTQTRGRAPKGENSCGETKIPMEPKQIITLKFDFNVDGFTLASESQAGLKKIEHFVPAQ